MSEKVLTKAFCNVKRMRLSSIEFQETIKSLYGSTDNIAANNILFSSTNNLLGNSLTSDQILSNLNNQAAQYVKVLKFDNTQLDLDATIDFDTSTTFELIVWNLKDEKEIIVGDQLELQLYWEDYKNPSDMLTISGFVTSMSYKIDGADMKYTITGDITSDWALTYLKVQNVPTHIISITDLLNVVKIAGISMIKTPTSQIAKQFLIKDKISIRDVLNMAATGFGADYTWTLVNDTVIYHKSGAALSQSLDVISLNNSDVIEYEIKDERMYLKTFGLPDLDVGSIFKYNGNNYFVTTIKHMFTHDGGYLCEIYSGENTNDTTEQSDIDESTTVSDQSLDT